MNQRQSSIAVSLLHAAEYAATRKGDFSHDPARPVDTKFAQTLANLAGILSALGGKQAIQTGSSFHQQTTLQGQLRDQLEDELSDIAHTAAAIAMETENPALLSHFRLPASHGDTALTTAARTMVAAIRQHGLNAAYESHGYPADTALHLEALIQAFQQSEADQGRTLGGQVGATAAIPGLLREGRAAVHTLSSIFRRLYKSQPDLLAAWDSASHIEKVPVRHSRTVSTPPPPPVS